MYIFNIEDKVSEDFEDFNSTVKFKSLVEECEDLQCPYWDETRQVWDF